MKIEILGTGCPKCKKLAERAERAAQELGIAYELKKVMDINEIAAYGVLVTPALAVDGEVKIAGTVPTLEEIKTILGK